MERVKCVRLDKVRESGKTVEGFKDNLKTLVQCAMLDWEPESVLE